ncbi:MAG: hypothetical protein V1487_03325 [bacterium]
MITISATSAKVEAADGPVVTYAVDLNAVKMGRVEVKLLPSNEWHYLNETPIPPHAYLYLLVDAGEQGKFFHEITAGDNSVIHSTEDELHQPIGGILEYGPGKGFIAHGLSLFVSQD